LSQTAGFRAYGSSEKSVPTEVNSYKIAPVVRKSFNEQQFLLASLPPSRGQIRLALGISVALLVVFSITAPLARIQLPRIDGFVPAHQSVYAVNDLITSALLFAQFSIVRRWALLVLAIGFLFSALIVIPLMLVFPGAFAPTGLLGAGLQTTPWLYYFWKFGLPLAVILYVLLKDTDSGTSMFERAPRVTILWSITIVIAIVCGLTWIATAGERFLPSLVLDSSGDRGALIIVVAVVLVSLSAVAFTLLWIRLSCVLDLWLMVLSLTLALEAMSSTLLNSARFDVGWYAARAFALAASLIVLLVLLSETTTLYASLARSVVRQRGVREARQIAMDAMAASIAHEVNQPLSAIVTNASAALRWLTNKTPDLDRARAALERVVSAGHRAGEVIGSVRAMFKSEVRGRVWLNINDLVREVLKVLEVDLRMQGVSVSTELREGLPKILVDRGQLQQVFLNLVTNAIEAMTVTGRVRSLRITSDINSKSSGVVVTVEDSGAGIDKQNKDRIFETFFTTKATGTGMGLTICRSIIESHDGSLMVSANNPYGTIFHVVLPSGG
jgi:signal transduction histidine kinase